MNPFEIFKSGTFKDSKGITKTFADDELDKIVNSYNAESENKEEAPIVIGHPTDDTAPAYGWIEKLEKVGDKILAYPKQIANEFAEMVKQGSFKKRSVSLDQDLNLLHVAFLGAVPPAVKGLADVSFADLKDFTVYEFEGIKIEEKLEDEETEEENENEFAEEINTLNKKIDDLKDLVNNFSEETLTEDERKKIYERIDSLSFSVRVNEFEMYLNEKLAYGSVTPAMKTNLLKITDFLQTQNFSDSEFSQPDFLTKSDTLLKSLVDSIPKIMMFEEVAKDAEVEDIKINEASYGDVELDEEALDLHKKALKVCKDDEISYSEAINKLTSVEATE